MDLGNPKEYFECLGNKFSGRFHKGLDSCPDNREVFREGVGAAQVGTKK